jgi:FtsP/CotA-like multicopper oxidase with cupredoxin domain
VLGGFTVTPVRAQDPASMCTITPACTAVPPLTNGAVHYDKPNYANSPALKKFTGVLPSIPVAKPGVLNGVDYYALSVEDYTASFHHTATGVADLGAAQLRGYRQLNAPPNDPASKNSYLGPIIIAERNKPVRLKLTNNITKAPFLPVDETVPGAGMGPPMNVMTGKICTVTQVTAFNGPCTAPGLYSKNRALLHLHGGFTPWISDGTPHQWTTPANDASPYLKGVSYQDVPDMATAARSDATYYYTNQQSARLMWYHDHSYGLTRLNVYGGQAAPYVLTDTPEAVLMKALNIPTSFGTTHTMTGQTVPTALGIPLVIQDKTFVAGTTTVAQTATSDVDPNWATACGSSNFPAACPASEGNLWFPHIYQPNQLQQGGISPVGRWDFGPWVGPPALIFNDKLPTVSAVPEAFMDTIVVNGEAYPFLEVPKHAVRLRILNGSNDRHLNLQLYYAVQGSGVASFTSRTTPRKCNSTSQAASNCTEVAMVPATGINFRTGLPYTVAPFGSLTAATDVYVPFDSRAGGVPDPRNQVPFIQIGNDGGLLPKPVLHMNQAIDYEYDRKQINALNVRNNPVSGPPGCPACNYPFPGYTLFLGPAERADIIVDFGAIPDGATLILYNDAPAPTPGIDPRYDLYTGSPDFSSTGGPKSVQAGSGPNTRTVMQFRVNRRLNGSGRTAVSTAALSPTWVNTTLPNALGTAYAASHADPIDSGRPDKGTIDPPNYIQACDTSTTATTLATCASTRLCAYGSNCQTGMEEFPTCPTAVALGNGKFNNSFDPGYRKTCGYPVRMKSIAEDFDPVYGRMNAKLGTEVSALDTQGQQTFGFYFVDPATEVMDEGTTEIWNIVHNGVDVHAVHFHLMNVQMINRVDWAGSIKQPDPNELGWKETIKVNPLENTIVAVRVNKPTLPWAIPLSVRPMDVTSAIGTADPNGQALFPFTFATTVNAEVDFGWEYVWHCHLLGHEENDMMRPLVMKVTPPTAAAAPVVPVAQQAAVAPPTPVPAPAATPIAGRRRNN